MGNEKIKGDRNCFDQSSPKTNMSELTTALETIFSWLKANYPKLEQSYKPGLSYEETKSYDNKLGDYYFTSEFYELYQWRNGTLAHPDKEIIQINGAFYIFADENYITLLNDTIRMGDIDKIEPLLVLYWLPLENIYFSKFEDRTNRFAILNPFLVSSNYQGNQLVCLTRKEKVSSLLYSETQYVYGKVYSSLTAKFLDLADSIDSNAYCISNTEYGRVLSVDTNKICRSRKIDINENDLFDPGDGTGYETLGFCS